VGLKATTGSFALEPVNYMTFLKPEGVKKCLFCCLRDALHACVPASRRLPEAGVAPRDQQRAVDALFPCCSCAALPGAFWVIHTVFSLWPLAAEAFGAYWWQFGLLCPLPVVLGVLPCQD